MDYVALGAVITPIRGDAPAGRACRPTPSRPVPVAWTRTSAPSNARLQIPRIARARGMAEDTVRKLVDDRTDGRALGFLGEPGVDVLELNLALDART